MLTFTTAPLEKDLEIAGPIKLVLYASSTASDTDFFVKLSEQYPQSAEDRAKGLNPVCQVVTRGWLRASHRALDPTRSTEMEPYHTHAEPEPLKPGEVYRFEISLEPKAYPSRRATASASRSSTAIRRSPTCCGRTTTSRTRSARTRSITTPSIRRR